MKRILVALAIAIAAAGCQGTPGENEESKEAFEQRMRDIEKRIKDSMPKTQEIALKQKVEPETLQKIQTQLRTLKEFLGEPTDKMDFVTVNSIQAFQRHMKLEDDGLLDDKTLSLLEREAKKVEEGDTTYFKTGPYSS